MKTLSEPDLYPALRPNRRIAPETERKQAQFLVWGWVLTVLPMAILLAVVQTTIAWQDGRMLSAIEMQGTYLCIVLACLVLELRAATPAAAAVGGVICLTMTFATSYSSVRLTETLLPALVTLFVLTFAATRIGHANKVKLGLAESKHGRAVNQIVANLGAASGVAMMHTVMSSSLPACIAMLAEATADTMASELGPLLPGRTLLLTNLKRVPRGTDGGVSVGGTLCGLAGAAAVTIVGMRSLTLEWNATMVAFLGAVTGFVVDSILGATLESRGYIGNDMVNFLSTVTAGIVSISAGLAIGLS